MNAIPPRPLDPAADARRERHLRQLQELAELGMAMARAVAQSALAPEAPAADPPAAAPPDRSRRDPGLVFARLACAVRQTIGLEARIAADRDAPRRKPPRPPDPRGALHEGSEPGTGRLAGDGFGREVDERLEDELEADPDGHLPIDEILGAICDDLGITRDVSHLPDEVLGNPERLQPDPPEAEARDDDAPAPPPRPPDASRSGPHGPAQPSPDPPCREPP